MRATQQPSRIDAWLCALGVLAACRVAAQAATVYVSENGSDAPDCGAGAGSNACRSLVQGVAVANDGDIVQVGPGDFPVDATDVNGVHITKRLDLRGAQYGVDARTRSLADRAAETVLRPNAPAATPYQGLLDVDTGASGTSIRGFRIEGTTSSAGNAGGAGIFTQPMGTDGGYQISDNILAGNAVGILLHSSGAHTVVSHNVVLDSHGPGTGADGDAI